MRRRGYEVPYRFAGDSLTEPRPLFGTGELRRVLYYTHPGAVDSPFVAALDPRRNVRPQLSSWPGRRTGRSGVFSLSCLSLIAKFLAANNCKGTDKVFTGTASTRGTGPKNSTPLAGRRFCTSHDTHVAKRLRIARQIDLVDVDPLFSGVSAGFGQGF